MVKICQYRTSLIFEIIIDRVNLFIRIWRAWIIAVVPFFSLSERQSRTSLLRPWQVPVPGRRHWRFRYCFSTPWQDDQRVHASHPSKDSQLGISHDSRTVLGPSQSFEPRHSRVLVLIPIPQETEHSVQSVQHDHSLPTLPLLHAWVLHIRVCFDNPSHGGDSHCLTLKNNFSKLNMYKL